jgi:hypothetical protein
MMRKAFGDWAERYSARLPEEAGVLVAEPATAAAALHEIVERRLAAEPVYVRLLLDDPNAALAKMLAPIMFAHARTYDDRRAIVDGFGNGTLVIDGRPQAQIPTMTPAQNESIRALAWFADGFVVSSWMEHERLRKTLHLYDSPRTIRYAAPDPLVPKIRPGKRRDDPVLVWAPELAPEQTLVAALALEELMLSVRVICNRTVEIAGLRARFTSLADSSDVTSALAVVDYTTYDPGAAIAFAGQGVSVAVPATSGAHEYLAGVPLFEPGRRKSIYAAAKTAIGRPAATVFPGALTSPEVLRDEVEAARPRPVENGPLFSLVMPTYNRRVLLGKALDSLARQTYRNFEAVIVNDCGEPVEDVVGAYPFARLVNNPQNVGAQEAYNVGIRHARGEYIGMMSDDDVVFPDFIAVMMAAIQKADADVVNAFCVCRYQEKDASGEFRTIGHGPVTIAPLETSEHLVYQPIALGSMVYKKSVWEDVGYSSISDTDAIMCISERYEVAHIDRAIYLVSYRNDASNMSQRDGATVVANKTKLFARHPRPDRPFIEQARAKTLDDYRRIDGSYFAQPAERAPVRV